LKNNSIQDYLCAKKIIKIAMGKSLDQIYDQIFKKRINNGENFYQVVTETFNEIGKIKGNKGINEMFIKIIRADEWKLEAIKYMIELGADPNYADDMQFLLLCRYSTPDVLLYLIEQHNVNIHNSDIIYYAGYSKETIEVLFDHGYFTSYPNIDRYIAYPKVIEVLLEKEYDINPILESFSKIKTKCSPQLKKILMDKIKKQKNFIQLNSDCLTEILDIFLRNISLSLEEVKLMIELGADPRYKSDKFLPLSCRYKNPEVTLYFITECGCDINTNDSQALLDSIISDNFDMAKILLELGIKITNFCIEMTLDRFDSKKYLDLIMLYETNFDRLSKLFIEYLLKNETKLNIAKLLVENGIDMNQVILTHHN